MLTTFFLLLIIKGMLRDVKEYLSKNFEMKDMGETSYVIGIRNIL
jgi:hypothetical protein